MIDWIVLVIGIAIGFFTGMYYGEAKTEKEILSGFIEAMWEEDEDE